MKGLAYIVDLVKAFSLLRAENDHFAMVLDTVVVRHKRVNFVFVMDAVNGVDGA